jgi:DNA-binding CsgD family transcriptional regulator
MLPDARRIELAFADLPVAGTLVDRRGKVLDTTASAAALLSQVPDLIARIAALATLAVGSTDALRHGDHVLGLTMVRDLASAPEDLRVVFVTRTTASPAPPIDPLAGLTPRQRDTALLAATGLRTAQLAQRLNCTERTVRAHLGACYRRLGVRSRIELTALVAGLA